MFLDNDEAPCTCPKPLEEHLPGCPHAGRPESKDQPKGGYWEDEDHGEICYGYDEDWNDYEEHDEDYEDFEDEWSVIEDWDDDQGEQTPSLPSR